MSAPVLVVGAGPVGLVTAAELLSAGVDVRVIDRNRSASVHSRATSLWPRILELLDRIAVTEELVDIAHRVNRVSWYSQGHHLGDVRFATLHDTPYPFGLALPQSITEDVLERRVLELGGTIERGRELLGVKEDEHGVEVSIGAPDGTETARVDYLVGADGAHSTVRRLLDVDVDKHPLVLDFAIGDATLDGNAPQNVVAYCWSTAGPMAYASLGEGVFRIAVRVPPGTHVAGGRAARNYDTAWFEQVLRARGPRGRCHVADLSFATTFTATIQAASAYSTARCFVVGDAAHVMSPAGGQGMNTGIQDAVNLSWKLAGVLAGTFPADALKTYATERPPAVRAVARGTARQAALGGLTRRRERLRRDLSIRARSLTGQLSREIAPVLGQLDTRYDVDPGQAGRPADRHASDPHLAASVTPGDRVPVTFGRHIDGWPQIATDRCTALLWNTTDLDPETIRAVESRLPELLARVTADQQRHPRLQPALGSAPAVALIRPDGHLLALVTPADVLRHGLPGIARWVGTDAAAAP